MTIVGWDIGGVNTKAAVAANGTVVAALARPYEIRRAPHHLVPLLRELAAELTPDRTLMHAVTMTAELSQLFRSKREGVAFVLDAVDQAFASAPVHVYTVTGRFITPREARDWPLVVAAANWTATAAVVARDHHDALLIDVGTTTTDIIPIVAGTPVPTGRTDPERLSSGELLYTGAIRTPVEAIVRHVPFLGDRAAVSAEGFALSGDVHVWRGDLSPDDYTAATPDGRPATKAFAAERLARVICADREMLDDDAITAIADAIAVAQLAAMVASIGRVAERHPSIRTAVVTGVGAFLGHLAAEAAGLSVVFLAASLGEAAARSAPASAVALLLEEVLRVT